jgi:hypothetical protein
VATVKITMSELSMVGGIFVVPAFILSCLSKSELPFRHTLYQSELLKSVLTFCVARVYFFVLVKVGEGYTGPIWLPPIFFRVEVCIKAPALSLKIRS